MTLTLPTGIGENLGDRLVVNGPLLLDQEVLYVNSGDANAMDAGGYGRSKHKPFATFAYAFTQAAAGDMIVLLDGHTETILEEIDIDISVTIVGSGQSAGKPTAKLINQAQDNTSMLLVSANHVQIRNIYFQEIPEGGQIEGVSGISYDIEISTGTNCLIKGCYFEGGGTNQVGLVTGPGSSSLICRLDSCTFISTATDPADLPPAGVEVAGGIWEVTDCVFDDGEYGWINGAFWVPIPSTIRAEGVSLLRGAKFEYYEDSSYFVHINAAAPDGAGGHVERNN